MKGIDDAANAGIPIRQFEGADADAKIEEICAQAGVTEEQIGEKNIAGPYRWEGGKTLFRKKNGEEQNDVTLANFAANIVCEEVIDDGAEERLRFIIEGKHSSGQKLRTIDIPAETFAGMSWVPQHWGATAIVSPGFSNKDHLRAAIQHLSGSPQKKRVYSHMGWRIINGDWTYLHAAGGISKRGFLSDLEVRLSDDRLTLYSLPAPPLGNHLIEAIHASLSLCKLGPLRISIPLLAATYLAPLASILEVDFSIFLTGPTGAFKTEATVIVQAHYGEKFTRLSLPGNWSSTENSLERQAFLTKDSILVVDDYSASGTSSQISALQQRAERLLRAQGNRAGRGRLRPDGTSRPSFFPRGIIVSSGEDIPPGHSLRARNAILTLSRDEIHSEVLSELQKHAADGMLSRSMAGFLYWLAIRYEELRKNSKEGLAKAGLSELAAGSHRRTTHTLNHQTFALNTFLQFAEESKAISPAQRSRLRGEWTEALLKVANEQGVHLLSEEPVGRFLSLLESALTSGKAHIAGSESGREPQSPEKWGWRKSKDSQTEPWIPMGDRIGWLTQGGELLLQPEASYGLAQRLARDQGAHCLPTKNTLIKRIVERGLATQCSDKNLVKRTAEGQRRLVLLIPDGSILYDHEKLGTVGAGGSGNKTDPAIGGPGVPAGPGIRGDNGSDAILAGSLYEGAV